MLCVVGPRKVRILPFSLRTFSFLSPLRPNHSSSRYNKYWRASCRCLQYFNGPPVLKRTEARYDAALSAVAGSLFESPFSTKELATW